MGLTLIPVFIKLLLFNIDSFSGKVILFTFITLKKIKPMRFIIKIILSSFSVFVAGWLLEGVYINNYGTSILVALVLAVLDYVIKPILIFLTIPITVFTFGLFLLVINARIPLMASGMIPGFYIVNFWWALAFSLIVSVLNYLINVK